MLLLLAPTRPDEFFHATFGRSAAQDAVSVRLRGQIAITRIDAKRVEDREVVSKVSSTAVPRYIMVSVLLQSSLRLSSTHSSFLVFDNLHDLQQPSILHDVQRL